MARAIKISSFFHLLNRLAVLTLVLSGISAWYLFTSSDQAESAIWTLVISTGVAILSWIGFVYWANRCRCQLCMAPLLSRNKCNKHKNASKLFGSYRTRLATSAIFLNRFRCYFCGEVFSCEPPPEKPEIGPVKNRIVTTMRRGGSLPKKD